jgi:O-antigen/teichoic acid export membrane protein
VNPVGLPGDEGPDTGRPSIAQSSRWVLAGTLLAKPLQLATNVLLARVLGPAGFGLLGLANTTALAMGSIASLGLNDATSKFLAEHYRRDRPTGAAIAGVIFWTLAVFCGAFFAIAWLARDLWGQRVFHDAVSDPTLALCLALGFVNVLFAFANCAFSGLQLFREATFLLLLQSVLLLAAGAALGYAYGANGAQAGYALAALVCVGWACLRLRAIDRRLLAMPARGEFRRLGALLGFGAPSWLAAFFVQPVSLAALSYLALQSGGPQEIGLFNSANGIKMLVAVLPGIVGSVIGPAIFEEAGAHGNPVAYRKLLDDSFAALGFLTVPAMVFLLFLSEPLFLVYGKSYGGSHLLFLPLATAIAIALMGSPFQFALAARNRTWWLLGLMAIKCATLLLLAWWWVPSHRAAGLAWATGLADVAYTVLLVETASRSGAVPAGSSRKFYKYLLVFGAILGLAWSLPPTLLWMLAVPGAAALAVAMVRRRPALVGWIAAAAPGPVRPQVQRVLAFISFGTAKH